MLNNYKIIKELGFGFSGTTYLVEKNNKQYALKIQHIFKDDIKYNIKSPVWREIEFSKTFAKKYPNQFLQLHNYFFISNCKYKQKYPLELNPKFINYVEKRNSSPFCSIKIYSLIDNTLDKLNLKLNEYYSILIQTIYAVYLLNKNGYIHADIHQGNIGIKKTDKKYIKIFGKSIPTFGNQVQIIDYETIQHKKYKINNNEFYEKVLKNELLWAMMNLSFDLRDFYSKMPKNYDSKKLLNKFINSDEDKLLKKYSDDVMIRFGLYQLIYPEKFQKEVFGNNKIIPIKFYIPIEDILYMVKNKENIKSIVKYLLNKIKN